MLMRDHRHYFQRRPNSDGIDPLTRAYKTIHTEDCAIKISKLLSDYLLIISAVVGEFLSNDLSIILLHIL